MQATSCGTPNLIQTGNQLTQTATGIRTPGIPQVQVIPQLHSSPFISQFPYNQQQQIMLQNAMQGKTIQLYRIRAHLKICMFPLGRPTHSKAYRLKSFYLNFRSKFFFISGISGLFLSSLFPFLHFTITGSFCWYEMKMKKKKRFTCFCWVGRPRGNIHIFKCGFISPRKTRYNYTELSPLGRQNTIIQNCLPYEDKIQLYRIIYPWKTKYNYSTVRDIVW